MATKAIHLELVSDLTSDAYIAALKRFIARRSIPDQIFSDNGTNFRRASSTLHELYKLFQSNGFEQSTSILSVSYTHLTLSLSAMGFAEQMITLILISHTNCHFPKR